MGAHLPVSPTVAVRRPAAGIEPGTGRGVPRHLYISHQEDRIHRRFRRQGRAVTLIQRFGSALNLNIHFHMLFLDGVYTFDRARPTFHRAPQPTPAELTRLLHTVSSRLARLLERQGLLVRDPDRDVLDFEPGEALDPLLGAAVHYRIAIGPNAGRKALTLRTVPAQPEPLDSTLLAKQPGVSLHAATCCEATQRDKLEKRCRYIARPAITNERLATNERGQVIYKFKQPFRDGTTHVVLDPLDFIARLAALANAKQRPTSPSHP